MSTIGSLLSIARGAIAAHQTAAQVVSQNIANAETEGYSRQRAELVPGDPVRFPFGSIGTGVKVDDIVRMRNTNLDTNFRRQASNAAGASYRSDLLGQIEGIFGEPSDAGLSATLDAFWSSWSDLANNPTNTTAQGVVRERGAQVAQFFNSYATRLSELDTNARAQLSSAVADANQLATRVAQLNQQIIDAESSGRQAPDLRDTRDRYADQLATLVGANAVQQADGTASVMLGGMTIVSGISAKTLEVRISGTTTQVALTGDPDPLPQLGGQAGAMLTALNVDIGGTRARLDTLARGIVNGVNFYHAQGWSASGDALGAANWDPLAGPTGSRVDFFDPANVTAATMTLSAAVKTDASVIAAGTTQNAPGDNTLALRMASLRETSGMAALQTAMTPATFATQIGAPANTSFGDWYRNTVTDVGLQTRDAEQSASVYDALKLQADNQRSAVSGVSIDEELTNLMMHQQAFTAASRLIKVADEMAQTVLQMV